MDYCHPVIDNTPLVQKVKVPDGILEFYDPDYPDQNIMAVNNDGVKFYNRAGQLVLEANKNAINWLGGSVIADSSRTAIDITSDDFLRTVTLNAGQIAELHVYVERNTPAVGFAAFSGQIVNWKSDFAPEVIANMSIARKVAGTDIGVVISTAAGSNDIGIRIANASGGKLIYELRYRLSMSY